MSRSVASQTKAVVLIGHQDYLLPLNKATELVTIMAGAIAVEYDRDRGYNHFRLDQNQPSPPSMRIVTDDQLDVVKSRIKALPAPRKEG